MAASLCMRSTILAAKWALRSLLLVLAAVGAGHGLWIVFAPTDQDQGAPEQMLRQAPAVTYTTMFHPVTGAVVTEASRWHAPAATPFTRPGLVAAREDWAVAAELTSWTSARSVGAFPAMTADATVVAARLASPGSKIVSALVVKATTSAEEAMAAPLSTAGEDAYPLTPYASAPAIAGFAPVPPATGTVGSVVAIGARPDLSPDGVELPAPALKLAEINVWFAMPSTGAAGGGPVIFAEKRGPPVWTTWHDRVDDMGAVELAALLRAPTTSVVAVRMMGDRVFPSRTAIAGTVVAYASPPLRDGATSSVLIDGDFRPVALLAAPSRVSTTDVAAVSPTTDMTAVAKNKALSPRVAEDGRINMSASALSLDDTSNIASLGTRDWHGEEPAAASSFVATDSVTTIAPARDTAFPPLPADTVKVATFAPVPAVVDTTIYLSIDQAREATAQNDDNLKAFRFLRDAQRVPFGAQAATPIGYYDLCTRDLEACQASRGWAGSWSYEFGIHLDRARLKELIAVNSAVNRGIRQATDRALYHVADRWVIGPKAGDCEDFALTKKARLVADGWPTSALLVALAKTRRGVDHAVLIVRTDRGDLVLDSLGSTVRGWSPSLYRWQSIQSPKDVWSWLTIGPKPVVALVSRRSAPLTDLPAATVVFE